MDIMHFPQGSELHIICLWYMKSYLDTAPSSVQILVKIKCVYSKKKTSLFSCSHPSFSNLLQGICCHYFSFI